MASFFEVHPNQLHQPQRIPRRRQPRPQPVVERHVAVVVDDFREMDQASGRAERRFAGKPEIAVLRLLGLFDRPAPEDEMTVLRARPYVAGLTTFLKVLRAGLRRV